MGLFDETNDAEERRPGPSGALLSLFRPSGADGPEGAHRRVMRLMFVLSGAALLMLSGLGLLSGSTSPGTATLQAMFGVALSAAPFTGAFHRHPALIGGGLLLAGTAALLLGAAAAGGVVSRPAVILPVAVTLAALALPPRVSAALAVTGLAGLGVLYEMRGLLSHMRAQAAQEALQADMALMLSLGLLVGWLAATLFRGEMARMDAAARAARVKFQEDAAARLDLMTRASHELRTPLNGVLGMIELLKRTPLSSRQTFYLDTAAASGEVLTRLVEDALAKTGGDGAPLRLTADGFDLEDEINAAVAAHAPRAALRGLRLLTRLQPDLPRRLIGDAARLRQMLSNLVENAVRFTPSGHILVEAAGARTMDGRVVLTLTVQDTGPGMREETRRRIFGASDAGPDMGEGGPPLGHGLRAARALAAAMGGRMECPLRPGLGAVFTTEIVLSALESTDPPRGDGRPILVISDCAAGGPIMLERLSAAHFAPSLILIDQDEAPDRRTIAPPACVLVDLAPGRDPQELRALLAELGAASAPVLRCVAPGAPPPPEEERAIELILPLSDRELVAALMAERLEAPPGPRAAEAAARVVLLVGSRVSERAFARALRSKGGLSLLSVNDDENLSRCIADRRPDLVVIDAENSQSDPASVARRLRAEGQGGTILAAAGDRRPIATAWREAGIDGVIPGPDRPEGLAVAIETWLRSPPARASR